MKAVLQFINMHFPLVLIFLFTSSCHSHEYNHDDSQQDHVAVEKSILTGAEQTELYFPMLVNKNIGIVTNQTGIIGKTHLIDSLVSSGFNILKIFAPEHGFRGHAEAGEKIQSDRDPLTEIRIISLYGSNFKPKQSDLDEIDLMIFDIQDVGVRFYTYISTMHYIMEACAEAKIPLLILDRPNPNGFYVDGPVLQPEFKSFIGMHPIPVVHGMTIGELALMINGEKWLAHGIQCQLTVIPVANYTHKSLYKLPVAPSPNLPTMESVYLYPGLCFFEGTVMSVGRGTERPFEIFGHPLYPDRTFSFTPVSKPGFAVNPPFMNEECFGKDLQNDADSLIISPRLELKWLIESYQLLQSKTDFFRSNMFDKLAGSSILRNQISEGKTIEEIRISWRHDLQDFKQKRKRYLLYDDFE